MTLLQDLLKNLGIYDRPRVLTSEPVYGVQVVLRSNQIDIATFVHKMADTYTHTHLPSGEQTWQYMFTLSTLVFIHVPAAYSKYSSVYTCSCCIL